MIIKNKKLSKESAQTKFFDRPFFTHTIKFFIPSFIFPFSWGLANGIDMRLDPVVMGGLCGVALLPYIFLEAGHAHNPSQLTYIKRISQVGFGFFYEVISYGIGYGLVAAVNYALNLF